MLTINCNIHTHKRIHIYSTYHERNRSREQHMKKHSTFEKMQTNQKSLCKAAYRRFLMLNFCTWYRILHSISVNRRSMCLKLFCILLLENKIYDIYDQKKNIELCIVTFVHTWFHWPSYLYNLYQVLRMVNAHSFNSAKHFGINSIEKIPLEWTTVSIFFHFIGSVIV